VSSTMLSIKFFLIMNSMYIKYQWKYTLFYSKVDSQLGSYKSYNFTLDQLDDFLIDLFHHHTLSLIDNFSPVLALNNTAYYSLLMLTTFLSSSMVNIDTNLPANFDYQNFWITKIIEPCLIYSKLPLPYKSSEYLIGLIS